MKASTLANLSPKHLAYISQQMIDKGFNGEMPYEEYDEFVNELTGIVKYFGEKEVSRIDMEFLASFINFNDKVLAELFDSETQNKQELYGKLIIPRPVEYTFDVLASGRAFVVETYKHRDISYNPEWFFPMIDTLRYNSDEFEYYDGDLTDTLVEDFDVDNLEIENIEVVDNRTSMKESILKRLVVENTESMIDSLDFNTLMELKRIIDTKLHSL
jgi:hypothetical protein